ncbi:MAG: hypothetical protein A2138_06435 [Deltaproteobacteria bacterium RBG_16_71_12]|nr:MAG: hypothetical protein A2138_06435 [Deltaproteobacteria bacterium RBG_16_71_12]
MTDPLDELIQELTKEPPEEVFRLYLSLVQQDRDRAQVAALALRELARGGRIEARLVPLLDACLYEAPDGPSLVHLAKALAAFGRKAASAAPTLADRVRELHVTNDTEYWILDGALWSLAYLGGDAARRVLDELVEEQPSRAVRSQSVYQGSMTREARAQRLAETLAGAKRLVDGPDPGVWREKKTTLKPQKRAPEPARHNALSVRARR